MRKLVGLAVVAGAAYAAKKIMANKKATTVSRPSDSKKSGKK